MSKILIIDDEVNILMVLKEYCLLEGYEVEVASDGLSGLNLALKQDFDCIILDLMMPNLDGFSVLKRIKAKKDVPIIVLSARNNEDDKLYVLENGGDDYVTKPFSPKEVIARIKLILKRQNNSQDNLFTYKNLIVDILGRSVSVNGEKINLTPKELDILIFLIKNKNIAVSRERLFLNVWKSEYYGDERSLDTHIKMLRKNLGEYKELIVTIRAVGYKFEI